LSECMKEAIEKVKEINRNRGLHRDDKCHSIGVSTK
jgi:hypothetical protein